MKNSLSLFVILGLISCFVLKNTISILNNSYGGDPIYIISNPSIDEELWYFLSFTYVLSVRVFFRRFFESVLLQLRKYKYSLILLDFYSSIRKTKLFNIFVKVVLVILSLVIITLTFNLLENNKIIDVLNWSLLLYFTVIFNKNFRIIGFKK